MKNTTARFILSAASGLGLAAFTLISALILGPAARETLVGFSLLAIYGLLEIAILSYRTPRPMVRPARARRAPARLAAQPVRVRAITRLHKEHDRQAA